MGSFDEFLKKAEDAARSISDIIKENGNIIIIGHLDADGIASSSLIGQAIFRKMGRFIIRILGEMSRENLQHIKEDEYDFHILCDLGGGMVRDIEGFLGDRWLLVDHHQVPEAELKHHNVFNAWRFGYDGSREVSAAGLAYFVTLLMDERNVDLSWLPIVAALGDRQDQGDLRSLTSLNRKILDEAARYRLIRVATDLIFYGRETRPIHEAMASTTTPFIPGLSGNRDACLATVASTGIEVKQKDHWRTIAELTEDEKRRVVEAIIPHLASSTALDKKVDELIGEIYILEKEDEYSPLKDAREFATVLNACGRMGKGGVGVSLCLGDRSRALEESEKVLFEYRQTINKCVNEILSGEGKIVDESGFNLVIGDGLVDEDVLGAIASILGGVPRFAGKVIIVKTITKTGDVKFSTRITPGLEVPVNLGLIMREAALQCDGVGGGHDAAAGAKIAAVRYQDFLQTVKKGLAHVGGSQS